MVIFELTKEQEEKFNTWRKEINKTYVETTAIGGAYSFIVTPTGLGPIIKVKHVCGLELDLTDEDNF